MPRLCRIGFPKLQQFFARLSGKQDDAYIERVCKFVEAKFADYSIYHVDGRFRAFSRHAFKRAVERNIGEQEIRTAGARAEIIEEYPEDKYSPSVLLLGRKQPIIICPARAIEGMRIPPECRAAFEAGRLLFLSPFTEQPKRVTKESALRRNELVAALADEVFIAHITPGGQTEDLAQMLKGWRVPVLWQGELTDA